MVFRGNWKIHKTWIESKCQVNVAGGNDFRTIFEQMTDSITDGSECIEIIVTSYNELAFALKSCFMYFAVFSKNHEIDAQRLIWLWIVEGLIPAKEFRTLEDSAESFLEDVAQR